MTNEEQEYRNSPYLNQSGMKKLLLSPAHYKAWLTEQLEPEEPEKDLRIGLATHCLSLQPERFDTDFAVAPVVDRRTTLGKQVWANFLENSPGKLCLTAEEYTVARHCADSVLRNSIFKKCMASEGAIVEKSLFVKDDIFRHGIKGRLDLIAPAEQTIVDIKTHGKDLSVFEIQKSIRNNKYHLQELVYKILCAKNDIDISSFVFIFVEKKEPFSSVSVVIENRFTKKEAADLMTMSVDSFNTCMDTGVWSDLSDVIIQA